MALINCQVASDGSHYIWKGGREGGREGRERERERERKREREREREGVGEVERVYLNSGIVATSKLTVYTCTT